MTSPRFEVDPDIRRARTPGRELYADPTRWNTLRDEVFAPSWQLAPEAATPRVRGDCAPATLLAGLLDEPVVFTHDGARVRCLSNVCTHRANLVVRSPCNTPALRCAYHGRRFELDGRFKATPGFEGVEDFPAVTDDLARVSVAELGALRFVSVAPALTLSSWLGGLGASLRGLPLDRLAYDPGGEREYTVRAHWALYCENYLEGFHIPFVHPGLDDALDPRAYRTELFEHGVLQVGVARDANESTLPFADDHPEAGKNIIAYYVWLFPNTMLNFYPWGLSANVVLPVSPTETRVRYLTWLWDASLRAHGAGADLDRVEREDEAVVEAVMRGVNARAYKGGRYSPTWERGVHHFHRMLAAALEST